MRQSVWGFCVSPGQHGQVGMYVWKPRELKDMELRPGTTLSLSSYLVAGSLKSCCGARSVVLSFSTCSKPRKCMPRREPKPSCRQIFKMRWLAPPCYFFCHGKWHFGSLKMPNKPLWANASQASQLALRTSSLKAMTQVLQRLAGECEHQRPSSQKSLLCALP